MPNSRSNKARSGRLRLRALQVLVLVLLVVIWHVLTSPTLLPPIYFAEANQAAFFFGEPVKVFARLWQWFVSGAIYVPSAMSWVFASLHNSVGLAFVGAVVGEYLGSAKGVGYLIHQAEGFFDMNTVVAGIVLLTAFALLLDWAVGLAERRLMVWQPRSIETERT